MILKKEDLSYNINPRFLLDIQVTLRKKLDMEKYRAKDMFSEASIGLRGIFPRGKAAGG